MVRADLQAEALQQMKGFEGLTEKANELAKKYEN